MCNKSVARACMVCDTSCYRYVSGTTWTAAAEVVFAGCTVMRTVAVGSVMTSCKFLFLMVGRFGPNVARFENRIYIRQSVKSIQ